MATNAMALTTWSLEYHQTMAAAERARREMERAIAAERARHARKIYLLQFALYLPLKHVTNDTEKLIAVLVGLENRPSSILLEKEAEKIPESLRELFRKMCDVLQRSRQEGLDTTRALRKYFERLGQLSQEISGFADRYEDAQNKLRSRVCAEDAPQYAAAFDAYRTSELKSDRATDEDLKSQLLHF